jgi:hypothetical protein
MSITRIIGGTLTKTATGNIELHATDGNINLSAATHNNWHGGENGIIYHDYEPINPNNSLSNQKKIRLNIFFDGTQNNKTNTESGKNHESSNHIDDSYTNDYSNVARGFDAIDPNKEDQVRVYIEGIGTENSKSETTLFGNLPNNSGTPLGEGHRGVTAKVTKACFSAADNLITYAGKVITLEVNVFGFSRGATAARHFLHIATNPAVTDQPFLSNYETALPPYGLKGASYIKTDKTDVLIQKHGFFGACLASMGVNPIQIVFRFVGLYDSVAAFGANHRGVKIVGVPIIKSDTEQLGLDAIKKAAFVLQFAAADEHRDNFDLTTIESAGIKGLEINLPGVHSDIGGCYVDNSKETVDLFYERYFDHDCKKFKEILIEEGWYNREQLQVIHSYTTDFTQKVPEQYTENPAGYYGLVGTRNALRNTYDKISLNQMFHYSEQFDVFYSKAMLLRQLIEDSFLTRNVYEPLKHYINACTHLRNQYVSRFNNGENITKEYQEEIKKIKYQDYIEEEDLKQLRKEYLHWSASATKFGLGPRMGGVKNATERTRQTQNG